MTATLAEKLVAAYDRMTPPDTAWLEAQGVPDLAIGMYPGPVGALDDDHFLQPIYSDGAFSDCMGICAWSRRDPSKAQIVDAVNQNVLGRDVLGLGQHLLSYAVDRRASLAVTASPLEFLRHYGATFCPLRWPDAAWELMHCRRLISLPADFGPELRRRLENARPRMPRIEVPV